jgi:hypothetical protein
MSARRKPEPVETVVSNAVVQFTHLAAVCPTEAGRATWARLAEQARAAAGITGPVRTRKRGRK